MSFKKIRDSLDLSKSSYVINKNVFRVSLSIIFLLLVVIFIVDGFDVLFKPSVGFCCPEDSVSECHNPFYLACSDAMCEEWIIPRGVCYGGSQPSFLASSFGSLVILIVAASLLLNHLIFNRKNKFGGDKQ